MIMNHIPDIECVAKNLFYKWFKYHELGLELVFL